MSLKGLISFAIGGSLLLFVLYIVILSGQSSESSGIGPMVIFLPFGFLAFLLLGLGLFLIIESAVASKK